MGFKSLTRNQGNTPKFLLDPVHCINCKHPPHLPICRGKPAVKSIEKIEEHSPKHPFFFCKPNLNPPEVYMAIKTTLPPCSETLSH